MLPPSSFKELEALVNEAIDGLKSAIETSEILRLTTDEFTQEFFLKLDSVSTIRFTMKGVSKGKGLAPWGEEISELVAVLANICKKSTEHRLFSAEKKLIKTKKKMERMKKRIRRMEKLWSAQLGCAPSGNEYEGARSHFEKLSLEEQ